MDTKTYYIEQVLQEHLYAAQLCYWAIYSYATEAHVT
jgi:hypothetical protein